LQDSLLSVFLDSYGFCGKVIAELRKNTVFGSSGVWNV
jgi:hypothetical protein